MLLNVRLGGESVSIDDGVAVVDPVGAHPAKATPIITNAAQA
jgi:hypothetical protein